MAYGNIAEMGNFLVGQFFKQPWSLFGRFSNFPHPSRCSRSVENCQNAKSFGKKMALELTKQKYFHFCNTRNKGQLRLSVVWP